MQDRTNFWLGVLANFCTVATGVVMVVIFLTTSTKPRLTYVVNPNRTVIGDPTQTPRLKVLLDNKPVKRPVKAARVLLFNDGPYRIEEKDRSKDPIRIASKPATPLIDAALLPLDRHAATAMKVDRANLSEGYVPIVWDYLEEDDGGVLQVFYFATGKDDPQFVVEGALRGQKQEEIRRVIVDREGKLREVRARAAQIIGLMLAAFVLATFYWFMVAEGKVTVAVMFGVAFFAVTTLLMWIVVNVVLTPRLPLPL